MTGIAIVPIQTICVDATYFVYASTEQGWSIEFCSSLGVGGLDFVATFTYGSVFRVRGQPA